MNVILDFFSIRLKEILGLFFSIRVLVFLSYLSRLQLASIQPITVRKFTTEHFPRTTNCLPLPTFMRSFIRVALVMCFFTRFYFSLFTECFSPLLTFSFSCFHFSFHFRILDSF